MAFDNGFVGRVRRQLRTPRRDRKAAILYCRSPRNRTEVERSVFSQKEIFIAEIYQDDETIRDLPPHARPILVRTAVHAMFGLPGGVLVDRVSDDLTLAVLGQFLRPARCELRLGAKLRLVTVRQVENFATHAVRAAVEEELDRFRQAVARYAAEVMIPEIGYDDLIEYVGAGPLRDVQLVRKQFPHLTDIRRYLTVYGYINPNGSVGRWSPEQVQSLRATPLG